MDRKNWPWRKKSSDKNTSAPDTGDTSPSHSSKLSDEQEISESTADHTRLSQDATDTLLADEQIRNLNEKLLAAVSEISAKDMVVKQHVKVAEEAISGWEKAEAEAALSKQKFELSQQEKLALEDRVSHLDGALKECMRQLRLVREEQEDAIHEALVRKTRDSEKLRLEMEAKLADISQQLIELVAEKSAFEKVFQERTESLSELGDAKSRAESQVQVLQARVDLLETENSGLKYELHLFKKEVEIRNEEQEYARKAAETSQKQHLENVKRITKLETECQRLRVLVKKKLPGPAALTQMRLEVEALGKDSVERKKKSLGKVGGPPRSTLLDPLEEGSQTGSNESEVLSEKLVAMEEQTKMLKEALESRTNELQEARLMCTKTASKLLKVEQQLDTLSNTRMVPVSKLNVSVAHVESTSDLKNKTPSLASVSGESCSGTDANHADIWASALIAELENFRKDKIKETPDKQLTVANLDLMDDFIEMERLATAMSPPKPVGEALDLAKANLHSRLTSSDDLLDHELSVLRETLATRDGELQAAHQLASELTSKLTVAEEKLGVLQSKNSANERIVSHLQERIKSFIRNQAEDEDLNYIFKGGMAERNNVGEMQSPAEPVPNELILHSDDSSRSSQLHLQPPSASSEESGSEADASTSVSDCDTKAKLATAVCKLVNLVELVAQQIGFEHKYLPQGENGKLPDLTTMQDHTLSGTKVFSGMKWSHPTVEENICKLVCFGNNYLQGKIDSIEFIVELSSVLDCILNLGLSRSSEGLTNVILAKTSTLESRQCQLVDLANVTSEDGKGEDIEELKNAFIPVASQVGRSDSLGFSSLDNEKALLHIDETKHDLNMMTESSRVSCLHEDLSKLKIEKAEIEQKLDIAIERIECLRTQISDAEQLVLKLRLQLASTQDLKQLAEDRLETLKSSKSQLESEVKVADDEINELHERLAALNVELEEERQQHQDAKARLKHFWQQLSEGVPSGEILAQLLLEGNENPSWCNDENQPRKEREIAEAAEKLAQCQRTILALGKQLKALASPPIAESVDSLASTKVNASTELICSSDKETQAVVDIQGETQRFSTHETHQKHPESSSSLTENLQLKNVLSSWRYKMDNVTETFESNSCVPSDLSLERNISSINLPRPSSPGRSPLKFKASKSRILTATADLSKSLNAVDSPPEKLSNSGFARFFSRTKSSHG